MYYAYGFLDKPRTLRVVSSVWKVKKIILFESLNEKADRATAAE